MVETHPTVQECTYLFLWISSICAQPRRGAWSSRAPRYHSQRDIRTIVPVALFLLSDSRLLRVREFFQQCIRLCLAIRYQMQSKWSHRMVSLAQREIYVWY